MSMALAVFPFKRSFQLKWNLTRSGPTWNLGLDHFWSNPGFLVLLFSLIFVALKKLKIALKCCLVERIEKLKHVFAIFLGTYLFLVFLIISILCSRLELGGNVQSFNWKIWCLQ